jgi:dTDP-4-amino-4,6-dideoxygalactose transaminase
MSSISVFGASVGQEEINHVQESIDKSWMGCGPKVAKFEELFSKRISRPATLVNNGSNALHLAVKLLNLPKGSDVVLPSFTFIACANAILLEGCNPIFADVELDGNLSVRTINKVITNKTKAIIVVHYAGKPVELKPILDIGIPVVEDVAHAVDSKIEGQYCGTFGVVSAFSFDPIKNLATPDLGCVVSESTDLVKSYRHCGLANGSGLNKSNSCNTWWEDIFIAACPKYMPNDIAAGIGLSQLSKLPRNQIRRKEIWNKYQQAFKNTSFLQPPEDPIETNQHSYFTYLIRVTNGKRNELAKYLKNNNVYTTLRFYPLHYHFRSDNILPNTDILAAQGLNLPLHPDLSDDDISRIIDLVLAFKF